MSKINFRSLIPTKRRNKFFALFGLLALIPAVAWAAFQIHLGIGGSFHNGAFAITYQSVPLTVVGPDGTAASNNGDITTGATLSVDAKTVNFTQGSGAFPGDTASVRLGILGASNNSQTGEVTGLTVPKLPAGWTAALTTGCGSQIPANGQTSVTLTFTVDNNAVLDGSTVDLSGATIDASLAKQAPANPTCTVTGGGA